MVWWQAALIIIGTVILAALCGIFLGSLIEAKTRAKEVNKRVKAEMERLDKEKANRAARLAEARAPADAERLAKRRAEIETRMAEERARLEAEARAKDQERRARVEAGHLARERPALEEQRAKERARLETEAVNKSWETGTQGNFSRETCLSEIRSNLKIATSPWLGKLLTFQTKTMDNNPGVFDFFSTSYGNDLREAYTDMAMANNIVWMVTDLSINSKDLEASYIKLCSKIAERLAKILQENA
jgi:flagellar biosynthesis GTPase FlhF